MAKTTYIKLDRNILNWRWYKDANTFRLFIHLLLKANIRDHDFEHVTIRRGEIATSYSSLANETGMSIQNVRTALSHLQSTGEVTVSKQPKFSIISITNYNEYQSANSQSNSQLTGNQQAPNRLLTGDQQQSKNDKNDKKEKNIYIGDDELKPCGKLLFLSDNQLDLLAEELGAELPSYIDRVEDWLASNPRPKEAHYQIIRKFIETDKH